MCRWAPSACRLAFAPRSSGRPPSLRDSERSVRLGIGDRLTRLGGGGAAEDQSQLVRGRLLELVVAAVRGGLVGAPALEGGRVADAVALEMVVRDLDHTLEAEGLPRQVLAAVPPRRGTRQALARGIRGAEVGPLGPFAPGVAVERVLAQRLELLGERLPTVPGERRGDADVVQLPAIVEQPEQQRPDMRPLPVLVPPEAGDRAVGGALVLDLEHRALAGLVRPLEPLRDHAVEAGALEPVEPAGGERAVGRGRRQVDRRRRAVQQRLLEARTTLALWRR